jgi:hypothetical protein
MAVEISILSGVRQGQRFVVDGTKFRAGSDPAFEVYFDPLADSAARDRSVSLCLLEDGWYIQSTGQGEVLVNQSPVVGLTRLKSGSIVRMSELGPEFEFRILARAPAQPAAVPGDAASAPPPFPGAPYSPVVSAGPSGVSSTTPSPLAPSSPVAPVAVQELARPMSAAPRPTDSGRLAVIVGGIILGCLVLLVAIKLLSTPQVVVLQQPGPTVEKGDKTPEKNPEKKTKGEEEPLPPPPSPPPPTVDPLMAKVKDAVLLIQVEKSGQFWPFATCCAISENTVLTSAREALQLGVWMRDPKSAFKAWVTNPASGAKLPVRDIRFYAVSVTTEKPDDWIFTNLALVSVEGTLAKTAELASPDELAQLAQGNPIHVFGYTHEGDLIGEADHFEVNNTPGKILVIAAHPDLPGKPRRLGIKAELPPKSAYGSPVVNARGKVVAIYSDPVVEAGADEKARSPGTQNMHYATVVNPGVIDLGLKKSDGKIWVSTADLKLPATTK